MHLTEYQLVYHLHHAQLHHLAVGLMPPPIVHHLLSCPCARMHLLNLLLLRMASHHRRLMLLHHRSVMLLHPMVCHPLMLPPLVHLALVHHLLALSLTRPSSLQPPRGVLVVEVVLVVVVVLLLVVVVVFVLVVVVLV